MHVDINADTGESYGRWALGDDERLLEIVTSANIACGFHAGDPATLVRTCQAAIARGVAIGAQVAYHDLVGFGRRFIDVSPRDLYADVLYQIGALSGIARTNGGRIRYVKPHGALYNAVVVDTAQAQAIVDAVVDYPEDLAVLGLPGSEFLRLGEAAGLHVVTEAFADRAYTTDGQLVPRRERGSVIDDPQEVVSRVVRLVTTGFLEATDGSDVEVRADSVCLHGDTPGAVELAAAVRTALQDKGVTVTSFVSP